MARVRSVPSPWATGLPAASSSLTFTRAFSAPWKVSTRTLASLPLTAGVIFRPEPPR